MKGLKRMAWGVLIVSGIAVAASACGGGASRGQRSHGIVKSVDAEARTVTLDHEDIPGLMKAMTMMFQVAPGVALDDLRPGAEVDFWVKEEGGTYTVTEIRRSGG